MRDDDERRTARVERSKNTFDQACTARSIEACRRLVEEQYRRAGGEGERCEESAALAARKTRSILAERLVESCRQGAHDIGKLCRFKGLPDLLLAYLVMQTQKIVPC